MLVAFKCRCMTAERSVTVPERRFGEPVEIWRKGCLDNAIYLAHRLISPACISPETEYVRCPPNVARDLGIGAPTPLKGLDA